MRLNLIVSVVLLAVLTSCGGNKSGQATEEVPADSALNDSLRNDSLMAEDYPMPKAADELFDDFVYNFVVNHKLQMERIQAHGDCEGYIGEPCGGGENPFRHPVDRAVCL